MEPNFFTPISSHQPNTHEKYHFLRHCDQLFNFGQRSVHITGIKSNDIEIADDNPIEKHFSTYLGYACKIAMIATVILPSIALVGKCVYRKVNHFTSPQPDHVTNIALDKLDNETEPVKPQLPTIHDNMDQPAGPIPIAVKKTDQLAIPQATPINKRNELSRLPDPISHKLNEFLTPKEQLALSKSSSEQNKIGKEYQNTRKQATYRKITEKDLIELVKTRPNLRTLNLLDCSQLSPDGIKYLTALKNLESLTIIRYFHLQDDHLTLLSSLRSLQHVTINECPQLQGRGLQHLTSLPLLTLNLRHCIHLDDIHLTFLTSLHSLKELDLGGYCHSLKGAGITNLTCLTELHTLNLANCKCKDSDLTSLTYLSSLEQLNLADCGLTGSGIKHLTSLKSLHTLNISGNHLEDNSLESLVYFTKMHTLNLSLSQLTDSGLKTLASLPLQDLDLSRCRNLTDEGIRDLALFPQLRTLNLSSNHFNGSGLKALSSLKHLQSLILNRCENLRPEVLEHLALLTELRSLHLAYSFLWLKGADLTPLSSLKQLQRLDLFYCSVTDANIKKLTSLPLQALDLSSNRLTSDGLMNLTCFSRLQLLDLSSNGEVTDDLLQQLASLKNLQTLDISNCSRLTEEGLKHLASFENLRFLYLAENFELKRANIRELVPFAHYYSDKLHRPPHYRIIDEE